MKATVSEKGQVTIPKPLRQRLGIKAGQVLEFSEEKGRLIAKKAGSGDPVSSVTGVIKTGLTTDQMMKLLRGKKGS
jgi:antitoxin PrlF